MDHIIYNAPSVIESAPSEVIMHGPGNVDISLTPDAAVRTADELLDKASAAVGLQIFADELTKRKEDLRKRQRSARRPRHTDYV